MLKDLKWKVGGAQGEGIDSTGEIFAITLNRLGYYLFAYRHFMSLVKGGHTNYKVRISSEPINYHGDDLDILIAFDQRTIDENFYELKNNSIIIYDSSKFEAKTPDENVKVTLCPIPLYDFAKELGNSIMKNMVATGASCAAVGLEVTPFLEVIDDIFKKKGEKIINLNREAIQKGFNYFRENYPEIKLDLPDKKGKEKQNLFMTGNEATGIGALNAGCRFLAAYPITPATEIMYNAIANFPKFGGKVIQAEDEIAACMMAIGGNFAGVRSMTSTSGPGLSLMMEALGLAGISETPLVIVDVQRGGPATGLPTKTEQSDINEIIYGSHGEIPRIVITPTTVEEAFYYIQHAFNLSEKYQCPVIVATDMFLGMSKKSVTDLDFERVKIDRGLLLKDDELLKSGTGTFKRYDLSSEFGISPRSIPGQKNGRYVALGNEHEETGYETEDVEMRMKMMDKRMHKLNQFNPEELGVYYSEEDEFETLVIGFGSTHAQINEAQKVLKEKGLKVAHLQLKILHPFPSNIVKEKVEKAQKVFVIENNATGQLRQLIQLEIGAHVKLSSILKYNGNPFTVNEIVDGIIRKV
ncbi:2-oxoglutarate ferredoxin oxidoreductase subunit alpha [Vulcanibacillus modesticaldus]|uniref:2-oxoglutarate ferredoxin oxidoreductase subunit alpha n=1 Tax=Vulcanibacillus modesticaldus TaxID=337097 RepID=A0A1D2YUF8_9BACI|nr:2-oxoacid:acceptor oxidoreductase subunit alpha [Vulcanibacillus modesticaldus]OEF99303.1 2-oxoglutarate ferredoxin oxidoreductase subunit alpha [Vulcanibacillus modesticaldus]